MGSIQTEGLKHKLADFVAKIGQDEPLFAERVWVIAELLQMSQRIDRIGETAADAIAADRARGMS